MLFFICNEKLRKNCGKIDTFNKFSVNKKLLTFNENLAVNTMAFSLLFEIVNSLREFFFDTSLTIRSNEMLFHKYRFLVKVHT